MKITTKAKVDIIKAYTSQLEPMTSIAARYDVSRQAIFKLLRKAGIDTTKHQIAVSCIVCNQDILRTKARIRKQKRHFCSLPCYLAWLRSLGDNYVENRQGQRIARAKVSKVFDLQPGHIVHHESGNCLDNALSNLKVFRNQGDHVRHHRGFEVIPIWDGSTHP